MSFPAENKTQNPTPTHRYLVLLIFEKTIKGLEEKEKGGKGEGDGEVGYRSLGLIDSLEWKTIAWCYNSEYSSISKIA